jgi:3'-phosphoadenosine 5'-phosphosulfate sulfotransferase (PAPS reductase)/FAD synthetase
LVVGARVFPVAGRGVGYLESGEGVEVMAEQIELWQLQQRQAMPLWMKEEYTKKRIIDWYDFCEGKVYVGFSGGKDSTVLLHQVRKIYPDVPAVFCDTGLEYPEIREFVKTIDNVVWLKPRIKFNEVISIYGYPVVSKKVSRSIADFQNAHDGNISTRNLSLTGITKDGRSCPSRKLSKKWVKLINAPFKISDKCCNVLKKEPSKCYEKESGNLPILGIMANESRDRTKQYLKQGCNSFFSKTHKMSMPMAFWMENDIWDYIKKYNVKYSSIYDKGESRTGCIFCMFGVHMDGIPNRFQRLKILHPKLYDYCINDLGIGKCLDYINVPYGDYEVDKIDNYKQQAMEL